MIGFRVQKITFKGCLEIIVSTPKKIITSEILIFVLTFTLENVNQLREFSEDISNGENQSLSTLFQTLPYLALSLQFKCGMMFLQH